MNKIFKRAAALMLIITCALSAITIASAYSFADDYPIYVVESTSPNGYCYQYSKPSSTYGVNLGEHKNGELVKVIDYYASDDYCHVICENGMVGYIRRTNLTPYEETVSREIYRVYSLDPLGYCYLYDRPSSVYGVNLGEYSNGEYIEIIDWYSDTKYAEVYIASTRQYGFIAKDSIVPEAEYGANQFYAMVYSVDPNGYCFMYSEPSSVTGKNLGKHINGEWVAIKNWNASDRYALVESENGTIGYIKKASLTPYDQIIDRDIYRVYSVYPQGYCYLYDRPSSVYDANMGAYSNGEYIEIIDWYGDKDYAEVYCFSTSQRGYMLKNSIIREADYRPHQFYASVYITDGYCYMYTEPSSTTGKNMGEHKNGEWVAVIDWEASNRYALVVCENGDIGYIKKASLKR